MAIKPGHVIAFFWLIVISLLYYAAFPIANIIAGLPVITRFNPQFKLLEHIFCLMLFIISANGWASTLWSNPQLSHLERFIFATAAGFGIMSLLTLFFNMLGVTNSLLYFFILISGFIRFIAAGKNVHGELSIRMKFLILFSAIPLLSTIIGALAPPTQFDSLVYHLALPADYLKAGKILAVPNNMFFSFPQGMEMLFEIAIKLGGPILANLLHWIFLPLGALAIYSFCSKFWSRKSCLFAPIIWLLTPAAMFVSTGTYVDLALSFYVFLSLYCFLLWKESGKNYFIYLCAIFSGFACGVKYTAFINVFIIALLFIFARITHKHEESVQGSSDNGHLNTDLSENIHLRQHRNYASKFKTCLKYVVVVLLIFSPWLLKNYLFLNNPIAPWGAELFTESKVTANQASGYFKHIAGHGVSIEGVKDLFLLPWELTFHGYKYGGGFDVMGPIFLLFIPILFLRMKIDKIEKIVIAYCVLYIAVWIISGKVMRFLMPIIPFLCILSGKGVAYLFEDNYKIFKYGVTVILALAITHNILLYHWVMASVDPYSSVLGGMPDNDYISNRVNYFKAADEILNRLGPSTKTVFLGETRSYYCSRNVIVSTDFDTNPLIEGANSSLSPDGLLGLLKRESITHIFINEYEFQRLSVRMRFTDVGFENWTELKDKYAKMTYKDKFCELYEITH